MDKLHKILYELKNYHRSREEIEQISVQNRLDNSLISYYQELNNSIDYIQRNKKLKFLNRLNK